MKSSEFAWSQKGNPDSRLFKFPLELNAALIPYAERLTCGAIRDGKHIQLFAKFQLKICIYFEINVFIGVAVITAKVPNI